MSRIQIDRDVEQVLIFMQRNIRANKLLPVAHAIAEISDVLWGHFIKQSVPEFCPFLFVEGNDNFKSASDVSGQLPDARLLDPLDSPVSRDQQDVLHK